MRPACGCIIDGDYASLLRFLRIVDMAAERIRGSRNFAEPRPLRLPRRVNAPRSNHRIFARRMNARRKHDHRTISPLPPSPCDSRSAAFQQQSSPTFIVNPSMLNVEQFEDQQVRAEIVHSLLTAHA